METFDVVGLILPAIEKIGNRIIGYDDKIRRSFDRALEKALKPNDEFYIRSAKIHITELVGLIVLVMDEPYSINTIMIPNYISRDEFRRFYEQAQRDEDLWRVLQEEWNRYKAKDTNTTLKAIDERIKELTHSVDKIANKIECVEETNKELIYQSQNGEADTPSLFYVEYFARDLLNGDIDSFLNRMKSFFADTPYELIRDLENHYQNVMFTFCRLLGFYTKAEYHTSCGRIDMVVKTQQFIYVFEFKFNKSAEEALAQIDEKDYPLPFKSDGHKVYKVGVNFSSKTNNMDESIWKIDQPNIVIIKDKNGYNKAVGNLNPQSPLNELLDRKLENKRNHHPSFRLMDIDEKLFPDGMITFDTEARDSNNELKTVNEIVAESWERGETNHLMIEGEGGIGKTVTLLSLPDKFAPHPVPAIYIPLHELKGETNTIEKYIKNQILDSKEQYDLLQNVSKRPWEDGPNLLLLLDGFNEIPIEFREEISENIEHWSELPGLQIITSSRFDIHQYVALRSSFSKIELQPLSEETVSEYLVNNMTGVPDNPAVIKLITIPLLLTLYIKAETIRNDRPSPFAKFKDTKNAGLLIWNYLQCELWRYRNKKAESKASVLALEFIAPYIAWTMQQHTEFVLDESTFLDRIEEAYNLMKKHIDAHGQLPEHIKTTTQQSKGLPDCDYVCDLLKEQLCLFIGNDGEYRLMHQQFRDALAAMHLINLSYLSGNSLPQEWNTPIDYYVMQFVVDLISEDEAMRLWEQNRKTVPAIENATRNQLELQKRLHDGDFSRLDFSGLNLSNISLYPYRINNAIIKLPTQSKRLEKTRISAKTFSAEGHTEEINTIAITPNGKYVISGADDCIIRIWDIETGELTRTLEGHKDSVKTIAVTPNGEYVVSGSNDRTIRIWNLETGEFIKTVEGHKNYVKTIAITQNGKYIVSGSYDRTIRIWSLESGELTRTLEGHDGWVNTVAVTPNGKYIISGAKDCTIRIWNMETGGLEKTLEGHKSEVMAVAVTPNGKYIISGAKDNAICIWDIETGGLWKFFGKKDTVFSIKAVAITSDGKYVIGGSSDFTIFIWELETGELVKTLEGHNGWINAVAVSPNGKYVVSGSYDRTIRVWNLETGEPTKAMEGHENWVNAVAVTPNGKHVIIGTKDRIIRIWNLKTGVLAKTLEGHVGQINTIAITPNGKNVVSGSSDWSIRIWELDTCELVSTLKSHCSSIKTVAVTSNGKFVVSGAWDSTICIWNLETGELTKTLGGHEDMINAIAVTPNGEYVVSGSDDHTIRIWDLETGELTKTLGGHEASVNAVAVTPNGKYVISGSEDCTIRMWNLETGELAKVLQGHKNWVTAVAVTSNGKHVVSGALDGTCLWDIETGELVKILERHNGLVTSVAVTPNGRYAVSGWTDGTIRITDIETYETQTIHTPPLSLVGLDFSKADISDPELKETLRQNGAKV